MVKNINELDEFLRKCLEDKIEVTRLDSNAGIMEGKINGEFFTIAFNRSLRLNFVTTDNIPHDLFDDIRSLLLKATGDFKTHVSYDKQIDDVWVSVIEWNFADPDELLYNFDCKSNSLKNIKNVQCYRGRLKVSYSILRYKDRLFVPLPEEQQLTEESLIALERRIAKAVRKNETMFAMSEYYATHMLPSMSDGNEDKEKVLLRKNC